MFGTYFANIHIYMQSSLQFACYCFAIQRLFGFCFFFFHSSIPNGAHSNAPSHPFSETLFQAILFNKQPYYSLTATRREQQQTRKWYRSNSNAQRKKMAKDIWYFEQFLGVILLYVCVICNWANSKRKYYFTHNMHTAQNYFSHFQYANNSIWIINMLGPKLCQ